MATGAGLAVGLCAAASTRRNPLRKPNTPPDEILHLKPLLGRVERLEHVLAEQSDSLEAMRHNAAETEARIQRLIASIDGLSDRMAPPVSPPGSILLPFEMQMSEAASRQATEEPRVRVIKETEPKRNRVSLARIFPLALIASAALLPLALRPN